jgi:hypothetical protein
LAMSFKTASTSTSGMAGAGGAEGVTVVVAAGVPASAGVAAVSEEGNILRKILPRMLMISPIKEV